jgi:hypothetical protein
MSSTNPYAAAGNVVKWFSPIQPVVNGMSESQKSRCRFAHSIEPVALVPACIMW